MPPFVIYKGKTLFEEWCCNCPEKTVYTVCPSGWMEKEQFVEWFKEVFLVYTRHLLRKKFLFLDGHGSHVSIELIDLAVQTEVDLLCVPAHTSHALQPLDVGVFSVVKKTWIKTLKRFFLEKGFQSISMTNFAKLLAKIFCDSFKPHHAVARFYKSALFPLDSTKVTKEFIELSRTYEGSILENTYDSSDLTIYDQNLEFENTLSISSPRAQEKIDQLTVDVSSFTSTEPSTSALTTKNLVDLLSPIEKASQNLSQTLIKHL